MIRKAQLTDVAYIHNLIKLYAKKGLLVPRTIKEIEKNLSHYYVYEHNGEVIACTGMRKFQEFTEIYSLAVMPNHTGNKIGSKLVEQCIRLSRSAKILALTKIPSFFEKFGFEKIDKSQLPQYILEDCFRCKEYEECEAMLK